MLRSPRSALIHEAAAGRASAAQAWCARPRGAACAKAESPRVRPRASPWQPGHPCTGKHHAPGSILPLLFLLWGIVGSVGSWEAALPWPVAGGVPLLHCWLLRWASRDGNCAGPPNAGMFWQLPQQEAGCRGVPGGWGELHPGAGPLSHGAEQPREPQRVCMAWLGVVVVPRAAGR